jgi:hypothetical protein
VQPKRPKRLKFPELKVRLTKIPGKGFGRVVSTRSYDLAMKAVMENPALAKLFAAKLQNLSSEVEGVLVKKQGNTKLITIEKAIETIYNTADLAGHQRAGR